MPADARRAGASSLVRSSVRSRSGCARHGSSVHGEEMAKKEEEESMQQLGSSSSSAKADVMAHVPSMSTAFLLWPDPTHEWI